MNETKVGVIIEAQDKASAQIRDVEKSLGSMKSSLEGMKPAFQTLATVGTGAFVALAGVMYKSVQAAQDTERMQVRMNQIFKANGKASEEVYHSLLNQSEALQKVGVVSDDVIVAAQGTLATFDLQGESIKKIIPAFLDMAVAEKGMMLGQQEIISLGNGLGKVLQGQTDGLAKQGFVFSEAQKDMLKYGTEAEKVTALVEILGTTYAGMNERMRGTAEGQVKVMSMAMDDLGKTIGNQLLPKIKEITASITPMIESFNALIARNPELVAKVLLLSTGLAGLVAVVGFLGLALPTIITGFTLLASPVVLLTAGLVALVAIGVMFQDQIMSFINLIEQETGLVTLLKEAWSFMVDMFVNNLLPTLKQLWETLEPLKPFLTFLAQLIGVVLVGAFVLVASTILVAVGVLAKLLDWGVQVATFFGEHLVNKFNSFIEVISRTIGYVRDLINTLSQVSFSGISNAVGGAYNSFMGNVRVNDAVVNPNGNVISTHPDDWLIATKNPMGLAGGGGLVINITGGNFLSETAGLQLGDQIVEVLRRNMKI